MGIYALLCSSPLIATAGWVQGPCGPQLQRHWLSGHCETCQTSQLLCRGGGDHSGLPVQDLAHKIKTKPNCKFYVTFLTLCCLWSSYKTPHMINVFDPQLVESLDTWYWDTKKWWYLFSTRSCHEIHPPLSVFSLNPFLAPSATTLSDSHWVPWRLRT